MYSNLKKRMFVVTILCSSVIFSSNAYAIDYDTIVRNHVESVSEREETHVAYTNVRTFLYVRKEPKKNCPWIGKLYPGEEMKLLGPVGNWTKIKWGKSIGYVYSKYISVDKLEKSNLKEEAETSDNESDVGQGNGKDVVDYACKFIGNPYVWGGTSLTKGADCSGFVQSVYKHFGVSLPRTSSSMRSSGTGVSYEEAQPGDIICYDGHVGIYMGDDKIVNAINKKRGIGILSATYDNIITVRRIL